MRSIVTHPLAFATFQQRHRQPPIKSKLKLPELSLLFLRSHGFRNLSRQSIERCVSWRTRDVILGCCSQSRWVARGSFTASRRLTAGGTIYHVCLSQRAAAATWKKCTRASCSRTWLHALVAVARGGTGSKGKSQHMKSLAHGTARLTAVVMSPTTHEKRRAFNCSYWLAPERCPPKPFLHDMMSGACLMEQAHENREI